MVRKTIVTVIAVLCLGAMTISAGEKSDKDMNKNMGKEVTMSGKLVCLGCTLKKTAGASSDCKLLGHSHVLETKDGKFISFLNNDASQDLISGLGMEWHDKPITVTGVYYANANVIDVKTFSVDGGKMMSWCDMHHKMDACAAH